MNTLYQNKIVKLISPINNDFFTIELTGDEDELKDLIGTIINVNPYSIKGFKDTYGNYYTFSSAIKNPRINSNYSPFYFIVISNNSNENYINNNNHHQKIIKKSKSNTFITPLNNNNYINYRIEKNAIKSNKTLKKNNINKNEEIALKLYEQNLIDKRSYILLNEYLQKQNIEILTLFKLFNNHNKNLKKLSLQIQPVLEELTNSKNIKKNENNKMNNGNKIKNLILNIIEKEINSKNDIELLKELLSNGNKQMIEIIENFNKDNNKKVLINSLNNILNNFRDKSSFYNSENNSISKDELILIKSNEKIEKKILKCFSSNANFKQDCILLFKYDMMRFNNTEKNQFFNEVFHIKENSNITQYIKSCIKEHYQNFILTSLFPDFNLEQTNIYNECINNNDKTMLNFFNKLIENNDLKAFIENVILYVNKIIKEKKSENENEDESDEDEEEESGFSSSSSSAFSSTNDEQYKKFIN